MRKQSVFIVLNLILFSSLIIGGGSFHFEDDLRPILAQNPPLEDYIINTLDLSDSGIAMRIGQNVNPHLGGKRIGPYIMRAKPKGSEGPFIWEITFETEQVFTGEDGRIVSDISDAREISEWINAVTIRVLDLEGY